jgi:hypothetical protein
MKVTVKVAAMAADSAMMRCKERSGSRAGGDDRMEL